MKVYVVFKDTGNSSFSEVSVECVCKNESKAKKMIDELNKCKDKLWVYGYFYEEFDLIGGK